MEVSKFRSMTHTSDVELSSMHLPTASACYFSIFTATLIFNLPSSSCTGSSPGLSFSFACSAVLPRLLNFVNATAACAVVVVVPVAEDELDAVALIWLTTLSSRFGVLDLETDSCSRRFPGETRARWYGVRMRGGSVKVWVAAGTSGSGPGHV